MAKKSPKPSKNKLVIFGVIVAVIALLALTTFNGIKGGINLGLDLQGGFEILYEVSPLEEGANLDMTAVTNSISKRVNVLGVSEPSIIVEGDNRVRVQLAGVSDQESAREMIGTTAHLTFRDVDDNELADSKILTEGGASLGYDENSKPVVSLKIKDTSKFAEITKSIAAKTSGENILTIWLDWEEGDTYAAEAAKVKAGEEPKYISAASVHEQISGNCQISGNFTEDEARTLANLINSGSLPVKMTEISSNVVSAQFGAEAFNKTMIAGLVGVIGIMALMIYRYRMAGVISSIMLVAYIWAVFGLYSLMGAVLTLSGIGALVLGLGMTVDVNIIDYERIRQEIYTGKSIPNAVKEGQYQSFSAIFDAQFTTLIAALIMYVWGNGAVKGFATMLIITVIMTFVINVGLSRTMMSLLVGSGAADGKPEWFGCKKEHIPDVSKGESKFYTGTHKFDYAGKAKYYIRGALAVLAIALLLGGFNAIRGNGFMNIGIDFSSGTKFTISSSDKEVAIADVSAKMEELGYKNFAYQSSGTQTVYATTKDALDTDQMKTIKTAFKEVYGEEPGDNMVSPVVGRDLVKNAVILTFVAWIAMMLYISIRYEWDYSMGSLIALVHDVAMVLAAFSILRMEVNIELISVLLTIIGYSINNSIIVFDRIREMIEEKKNKKFNKDEYAVLYNEAMDATIMMSLMGAITTIIPVIFLLLMGSSAIITFNFAMFVGLIAGTFSSIFIAPSVWMWLRCNSKPKKAKKVKKEVKEELDEYTIKGINA